MNNETSFKIIIIDDNISIHQDIIKILTGKKSTAQLDALKGALFGEADCTKSTLSLPNFYFDTATQGQEGVECIKKALEEGAPHALAFVDIRMPPGWNGLKTIRHIFEFSADIQIVICTAFSDFSWEETFNELGINENVIILKKPFDAIAVRQLVCALTRKWQLTRDAKIHAKRELEQKQELQKHAKEIEKANEELKIATHNAKRANAAKSEFLSSMSHELRTPMHAILSYASLGLENLGDDGQPSLKKYFGNIQTAGKRLLSLLNNLLDLAKIESGKMEFHFKENDFRTVVEDTLVELNALLTQKGMNVNVQYESVLQKTVFDREKIVQVLVNLMSNAIKFSPESSTLHIKVGDTYLDTTKEDALLCRIMDEGVGIPIDEVDSVFEKFIQSSKTKTQAGGTGLGLSICKQIVEAHGGRIWAENGENVGSVFQFQLPLSPKTTGGPLS